jgi:hypothetical protein
MSKSIPAIGQAWPEQGGIYIGARLIDGAVHHVVIPGGVEHDIKDVAFQGVQTCIPTELNGQGDWRAPDQEDLMLAWINAREHFEKKGIASVYWSRTERADWAWAVDFEDGFTNSYYRGNEFRVRPFRSFPDSAL